MREGCYRGMAEETPLRTLGRASPLAGPLPPCLSFPLSPPFASSLLLSLAITLLPPVRLSYPIPVAPSPNSPLAIHLTPRSRPFFVVPPSLVPSIPLLPLLPFPHHPFCPLPCWTDRHPSSSLSTLLLPLPVPPSPTLSTRLVPTRSFFLPCLYRPITFPPLLRYPRALLTPYSLPILPPGVPHATVRHLRSPCPCLPG